MVGKLINCRYSQDLISRQLHVINYKYISINISIHYRFLKKKAAQYCLNITWYSSVCLGYERSQQWIDELKMLVRESQIDIYILKTFVFKLKHILYISFKSFEVQLCFIEYGSNDWRLLSSFFHK